MTLDVSGSVVRVGSIKAPGSGHSGLLLGDRVVERSGVVIV